MNQRHTGIMLTSDVECAYVLRFVELNHRGNEAMPWSSRQFAVYHKFESVHKSSTWVFIALSQRAQVRLEEYIQSCGELKDINPFEVHALLLDTAISNWRQYMIYLTAEINDRVCSRWNFNDTADFA